MKFIVDRVDGVGVPFIFDEAEIKTVEFFTEERVIEAEMPAGFPKNYPGAKATKKTQAYCILMTFKDGDQKKLIFEMSDRQLWVQAMNKLCDLDFEKLRTVGHV